MTLRTTLRTALLALLLAAPGAFAAPPSDAQVDRLMELTRARDTLEAMWPQLEAMQRQIAEQALAGSGKTLDKGQRAELDAMLERQLRTMQSAMSWEHLEPIYREIYQQTFESEDVDAMIAFYESEAGQKLIAKTPQLMQNTMRATQRMIAPMLEEMQRDIQAAADAAGGKDSAAD
ncbi:DUF2059 domain-containing protein [Marilutibacter chinensis]|uniref:DUF2059 domain-containing protein n=1 Tax=Marilutibacter chinensis TaxID=2912247 RepID=A0ABS9HRV6_9GAMM|nr:DUF2059 domain-containing protein [Lysobacter chinensis]MCF7221679.1 DUF2059 domain-containing protein [Lysobacter chinensis]